MIEIEIAAGTVPTLASVALVRIGQSVYYVDSSLSAVLGWFLGFPDRRNTPALLLPSRTESVEHALSKKLEALQHCITHEEGRKLTMHMNIHAITYK
jgi:hypothetical protein